MNGQGPIRKRARYDIGVVTAVDTTSSITTVITSSGFTSNMDFCDVSLNSRDYDEPMKEVFLHLLMHNAELPNVKVIRTLLMETLFHKIVDRMRSSCRPPILIIGPPSTGKSTTALWLYRQLKHHRMSVKAIKFSGASTVEIVDNLVVICDCNQVSTAKDDDLKALMRLRLILSERGGLLVIAASALLEILYLTTLPLSSTAKSFMKGMERVSTSGFDATQAKSFIDNIAPNANDDMVKQLISETCGVPGLLRECILRGSNIAIIEHLTEHLTSMLPHIPQHQYRHTIQLLTAVLHNLPLSTFQLGGTVLGLCVVKGNFVIVDGNKPPKLYVSTPRDVLIELIKTFTNHKNYFTTDEESALGYLFEGVVVNNLKNIELTIQEINNGAKITVSLNLQFSFERIRQGGKCLGKEVLWQTQKRYFGVDFIAIATLGLPANEDVLLLFQVSTRRSDHKTKCEPLIPPEVHLLTTNDDTSPPTTIVYLYINPFFRAEEEYDLAYSHFCNHKRRDRDNGRKWFFGVPSSRLQLQAVYQEMQLYFKD